ncbi:MAG: class E sortase [Leifsonia sp.]
MEDVGGGPVADGGPSTEPAGTDPRPPRRRGKATVLSVLGELLITAGVGVLLFIAWQLWWNDWITADQQTKAATSLSEDWINQSRATDHAEPTETPPPSTDFGEPAVLAPVGPGTAFAVLYVPRFGDTYRRTIAEGTGTDVLNSTTLGIGHYPNTQMPGQVGNFVVAAHRSAYGGGMHLINELQLDDPIVVQTQDGWYTYRFRSLQYVHPTQVEVLAPVPGDPSAQPTDRMITLTSCNPLLSTAERIIAYGVFESWQPTSAGPPAEIAALVAAQASGG